jgi:hypothetical protein
MEWIVSADAREFGALNSSMHRGLRPLSFPPWIAIMSWVRTIKNWRGSDYNIVSGGR